MNFSGVQSREILGNRLVIEDKSRSREQCVSITGEQGCRTSESARLTPVQLIPTSCHMWVEFVVASRLAPRVFLELLRFSSLLKDLHLQIPIRPG